MPNSAFRTQYGPWALIAGASEGTGRAYARQLAEKGLSLVLVARREAPLKALAAELQAAYGVACRAIVADLARPDAAQTLAEKTADLDIGLFVANAGSDPNGARFLDQPFASWADLLQRNVTTALACAHHFAGPMVARGRGGILLANSYVCYGGGSFLATYAASKAALLVFAESLWAELHESGVDVLTLVMYATDTPELRRLLAKSHLPLPPDAADPEEVAAFALAHLADGPVQNWGLADNDAGHLAQSAADRRARVLAYEEMKKQYFPDS